MTRVYLPIEGRWSAALAAASFSVRDLVGRLWIDLLDAAIAEVLADRRGQMCFIAQRPTGF